MVTVTRFAEAVLPHGTTTAFIDNHEMANVFGLEGMRWMLEEGRGLPLKVYLAVPSCVPALPGFEDAGASLGPGGDPRGARLGGSRGLGEMMNMPGVIEGDEAVHAAIAATLELGKPVTGHWSLAGWRDHRLQAYIAAGVDSCHETTSREDALAKLRAGMWVQFREGSTFRDVAALAPVLTEDGVDSRHCLLVTDDVLPDTIVADGHMDRVLRRAVEEGIDPLVAIQMATLNGAEYFNLRHELGSIAPGPARRHPLRRGPRATSARTACSPTGARWGSCPPYAYPPEAFESIRLARPLTEADLRIEAEGDTRRPSARSASPPGSVDDRAPDRRAPGRRRRGPAVARARRREARERRAPRRPGDDRARLRQGPRPAAAARSPPRSRTTTTTCSSPA